MKNKPTYSNLITYNLSYNSLTKLSTVIVKTMTNFQINKLNDINRVPTSLDFPRYL